MSAHGFFSQGSGKHLNKCHYCEQFIPLRQRTRDHVLPKCNGGILERGNVVMSCGVCNSTRNNIDYETWYLIAKLGLYSVDMSSEPKKRSWYKYARKLSKDEILSRFETLFFQIHQGGI